MKCISDARHDDIELRVERLDCNTAICVLARVDVDNVGLHDEPDGETNRVRVIIGQFQLETGTKRVGSKCVLRNTRQVDILLVSREVHQVQ